MREVLEIRWHGRGGQGAKTAALLLAEVVSAGGKYVQGFPEYGPERMGAPIVAFNRISPAPIPVHCHVTEPDIVVVLDPTLMGKAGVMEGLSPDGTIIVNTPRTPSETSLCLNPGKGQKVYTVNASQISLDTLGKNIPNTPMIGALVKVTGLLARDEFTRLIEAQLKEKFKEKKAVIAPNLEAINRAYEEVRAS
ncbi:MAG: 2-oxoacid:acceptor oxidoreductase family protein [Actinobacteria bacterium]|nr:2-oxoacid:acceptor oxidoreductase family protein [Actinomycetota bacterium]